MVHTATFDDLYVLAAKTELRRARLRQRLADVRFGTRVYFCSYFLAKDAEDLVGLLRSFDVSDFGPDFAAKSLSRFTLLSDDLAEVLRAAADSDSVGSLSRSNFERIERAQEWLEDILEAWQLSYNKDFIAIAQESLRDLGAVEERPLASVSG